MRRSRVPSLLIAPVALLLAISACAGESTPPPSAPDGVTLTVWITDRVSAPGMVATQSVIDEWEKKTGNSVKVVESSFFDQMNKIPVAVPAGNGPDVFMLTNNYIGQFQSQQLISAVAVPDATKSLLTPGSVSSFTLDGKQWGVPVAADVNALVYNKKLLTQVPSTFSELVTTAAGMTGGGKFGLLFPIDQYWWDHAFIAGYGGYVFKPTADGLDVNDIGLANDGSVQALTYLRGLVNEHKLMPADTTADVMTGLFKAGKAAAIITGPTSLPDFEKAGIEVGVAALPTLANGQNPKPFATYTGFSMSSKTAHQQQSADLMAYLAEHLPAQLQKASAGNISVLTNASTTASAGWVAQLQHSDPLPSVAEMNHVWGPIGTAVTNVVHGKGTAAPTLATAVAAINKAVAG